MDRFNIIYVYNNIILTIDFWTGLSDPSRRKYYGKNTKSYYFRSRSGAPTAEAPVAVVRFYGAPVTCGGRDKGLQR